MVEIKAKPLAISTGGTQVVLLTKEDAQKLHIHRADRVLVSRGRKKFIAIVDTTNSSKFIKKGQLGLFSECQDVLKAKTNQKIDIEVVPKPRSVYHIAKKLRGGRLCKEEIYDIIQDIVDKKLTETEMTYFVSACYTHELSFQETVDFTNAMVDTGKTLHFGTDIVADKHCIGGVAGNRTTCVVVPIIAAAGYKIPKTSSRSITSPAGTADTMEVLCDVVLSVPEILKVVKKTNACMVWGGAVDVAPSDDTLIKVEHPMSLDPVGQMLASVLAKKKAAGATHCLIDIPLGKGAKVESRGRARMLRRKFEKVGRAIGMNVKVAVTDGSSPIGNGIGPALEARDLLWTLQGDIRGSSRLIKKSIKLAGILLKLLGEKNGEKKAQELLENGEAAKKFFEILKAQGQRVKKESDIEIGPYSKDIKATGNGKVRHIDNKTVSRIARVAGAPRDKSAGVYLHQAVGDKVDVGDILLTVYAKSEEKLDAAVSDAKINSGFSVR